MHRVLRQRKTLCLWTWGKQQTWYVWQMPTPLYLTCSLGNGWWEQYILTNTYTETQSSHELYFLYLASFLLFYSFSLFTVGLSKCTDAPFFTGSNYPSTPPLPAPHSAQIQRNSFHYCCVTKGHICQCGVVSVSTDAFSSLTHPLAVLCVPLSTCTAPPFLFPCGSPTLGIILFYPQSSLPWRPSHPRLKSWLFPAQFSLTVYGFCSFIQPPHLQPSPRRRRECIEG